MSSKPCRALDGEEALCATRLFLARLFRRASAPLVAGLVSSACASDVTSELSVNTLALDAKTLHCQGTRWRPMSALKLSRSVDFVELRRVSGGQPPSMLHIDAAGLPCAKASQPRLCDAELRRVSLENAASRSQIVLTQGDVVQALTTLDEKLSLLGTIDTPDEALLVLEHNFVPITCGSSGTIDTTQVRKLADGYRVVTNQAMGCNLYAQIVVDVASDGSVTDQGVRQVGSPCPPPADRPGFGGGTAAGRRPPNLLAHVAAHGESSARARYFARIARLEAASVAAFEQLAAELRVLGAPAFLQEAALSAADDEVRHARSTARLAERFGARPELARLARTRLRGRAEIALDNALEGCVHETYAAYLAHAQAELATERELTNELASIAADETRHAALSWQLAAWFEPQLAPDVQRKIGGARLHAMRAL